MRHTLNCAANILHQLGVLPNLTEQFRFSPSKNGIAIGALFEIYQHLSRHNVVGFPGMPNYPDKKGFTGKLHARSTPEFSFPEMFLSHEHGSLLTKVVMFWIIFSI